VNDGVVLDLRYEARYIDQRIASQAKIDQLFPLSHAGVLCSASLLLNKENTNK
jgi:hypothetical protein